MSINRIMIHSSREQVFETLLDPSVYGSSSNGPPRVIAVGPPGRFILELSAVDSPVSQLEFDVLTLAPRRSTVLLTETRLGDMRPIGLSGELRRHLRNGSLLRRLRRKAERLGPR